MADQAHAAPETVGGGQSSGHPGPFRPGFADGGVGYTHPAGGAFSPLRAAGYVFVGKEPRYYSQRSASCLYPRERSPPAVVLSKTRGLRAVVWLAEDAYIAAGTGRGASS